MKTEIKCPKCSWQPAKADVWACSCNHVWNTFGTGGKCPECSKVWEDTQCPNCYKWSRHLDWYPELDGKIEKIIKEVFEKDSVKS